ncbi:hypothetical protein SPI_06623 [Niveomyces insectorum RCEF 264]|uniref:Dihydroflavonal-4-reductase protein n=1 Tax=Niveomyces insectorum RCEF 264 TaxID=1081102 RepID=A0A167RFT5_9HYPO|nr:hypothetical protein SPI_06623 [Niveomyces insectorum RCEF 264]
MAALVQTYPQQTGTVTMLQTRPASAGGIISSGQPNPQYAVSQQHRHSFYGNTNGMGGAPILYRSNTAPIQPYAFTSTPSLNTNTHWQQQQQQQQQQQFQQHQQHLHQQASSHGLRASSATPVLPKLQGVDGSGNLSRTSRQPASASMINLSTASMAPTVRYVGSRDDSSLPGQGARRVAATPRPQSAYLTGSTQQLPLNQATPGRAPPDRYRRGGGSSGQNQQQKQNSNTQASAAPSGSGMASIGHLYAANGGGSNSSSSLPDQQQKSASSSRNQTRQQMNDHRRNSFHDTVLSGVAADDISLHRQHLNEDLKRFRRRSMPSLSAAEYLSSSSSRASLNQLPELSRLGRQSASGSPDQDQQRPTSSVRNKNGSSESVDSRPSSTKRNATFPAGSTVNPAAQITATASDKSTADKNNDSLRLVNIPPRVSSDAANRLGSPSSSPKSTMMDGEGTQTIAASAAGAANRDTVNATNGTAGGADAARAGSEKEGLASKSAIPSHLESPAMRHLSAINQKGGRLRSKTSKLRRAFSFGSAADFRKAAGPDEESDTIATPNKLQKEPTSRELYDAEQARIAQQQEEGGIGNSIYAGARIFSGSTDNLSISSTASSASIMIRKMGRGMKKSTRSLVGLFRPKSVVGVPAADASLPEANTVPASSPVIEATVSMVTVEAERERVNVNADLHTQNGGGTGFPRLERNSIDASKVSITSERVGSSGTDQSAPRKSIVEGDKERAEVLAAVRKGILKNTSGTSSPSRSPADGRNPALELPGPPTISDSPASSAPSTPNDEAQGHKRSASVALGGEDYFVSALRLRQDSKSGSSTPQGSMRRCATFSPRIVFYDTWPSQEYDRRGEIATCNRLTPMLAQQIKEELNTFKMEMEVHENSKIYTHFF